MQHIDTATVNRVIDLANEASQARKERAGRDVSIDEAFLASVEFSSEERTLLKYLEALSRDQIAELLAIMWIGRGHEGETPDNYDRLVRHAHTLFDSTDEAAPYMIMKSPLAAYLASGLQRLRFR